MKNWYYYYNCEIIQIEPEADITYTEQKIKKKELINYKKKMNIAS